MLKKISFFFIFLFLLFLLTEIILRTVVYIKSKDLSIFLFGINKSVEFKILDISEFNYLVINHLKIKKIIKLKKKKI